MKEFIENYKNSQESPNGAHSVPNVVSMKIDHFTNISAKRNHPVSSAINKCPKCGVIQRNWKQYKYSEFLCDSCHNDMLGMDEDRESLELYARTKEQEVIKLLEEKRSWEIMLNRYQQVLEQYRFKLDSVDKIFDNYMLMSEPTWRKIYNGN